MSTAVVFVTTGGEKIKRAIRSFRRTESVAIHVVLDVNSNTWRTDPHPTPNELRSNFLGVQVREYENLHHINGVLNEGMRWMREKGYSHVCLFHDDIIFTPFLQHRGHISKWFDIPELQKYSAITLSCMETGITGPDGDLFTGRQPNSWWDSQDLESEHAWYRLMPGGEYPEGYHTMENGVFERPGPPFAVRYYVGSNCPYTRLGPTGQIVPIEKWDAIGGFDQSDGIHYDSQFPMECALRGFPHIKVVPNIPHIHIHNQSIGYLDPSTGLYNNVSAAFERKYRAFLNSPGWPKWLNEGAYGGNMG
jgi:hypothetical protein